MNEQTVKILLVDDTPENLVALEALLRRTGVELISVRSGAAALEQCLIHELSLALLDVQMPEMDGFELAELMRGAERTKHVPIVFVTAAAHDVQRTFKGYETGAVDFLYKPIDPQILTSKVNVFIELARQRHALTQALQLNELFVGILGHDLRNPLAAMMAGVDLLSLTLTEDKHLRALERMRSSGKRMETMINDMLDLTRARFAPGLGLARSSESLELHQVLAQTIEELRVSHSGREIHLEGLRACPVSGDRERLLQLFSNLLANAVHHGKPDTAVTVRIADASPQAVVEVHNFGVIPAEMQPTLFEPFRRTKRSNAKGLGLGLYIARQIAQAHGGDIAVRSDDDVGTVFKVRLPGAV